ncbi:hypothetical protein LCI18_007240 [Fusarium solani-melongenae]|uniref:Uncharacterized protein n=1 Tax=Fusarium solani subsp. cucurbitae TaxID=2747967 RepID=A0ACD3Z516_FUSSC|nr:hypothetical protein LCI18_007240 [Fusarium solani-melongenae]
MQGGTILPCPRLCWSEQQASQLYKSNPELPAHRLTAQHRIPFHILFTFCTFFTFTMGLSVGQAIGIGFVAGFVGFVGALVLILYVPTPSIRVVKDGEPVHTIPELPQQLQQMIKREADPKTDSLRWFSRRMLPLGSVREIAEVVEFEDFISSFTKTCIKPPFRPQPLVPESLFDENELVRLAGKPANGGTWSASISNTATRASAVKCFLAQLTFKRMNPNCPPQECLLPPEIASCYQFVCIPHGNPRSKLKLDYKPKTQVNTSAGEDLAAIWRESMYLLLKDPMCLLPLPPRWFEEGDPREERTHAMVPVIIDALRLKTLRADRGPEDDIERSITGILERSANSALHLLAQPSEWEAVWVANEPGFIVFPEIRLVWNGYTKFSKPAVVDAGTVWPIPSDDKEQAGDNQHTGDEQQPEVDALEQPKPDTEKLVSLEDGHSVTFEAGQEPGPTTANQ